MINKGKLGFIFGIVLIIFLGELAHGQQRLEWEHWDTLGVGKLVTKMSNTNNIGSGRLKFPVISEFPAFEYPFNPEIGGRHINYAVGVSFHVGGFSLDKGPTWNQDPNTVNNALLESGDQASYRFYKGFHFDGHPDYCGSSTDQIPISDDSTGWPVPWPTDYPTTDPVLERLAPNYPTAYSQGMVNPKPLMLDTLYGFPGAGPNKNTPPGRFYAGQVVANQESFTLSFAKNRDNDQDNGHLMIYTTLRGLSWKGDLAEDFLFWMFTVTNVGTEPIDTTYIGMFAAFDFPWASHTEYNTYSRTDCFAFDAYDFDDVTGEEYKIGYGWDGDGTVAGATYGTWDNPVQAKLTDETPVDNVALA